MRKFLLAATMLTALASGAKADAVNNLNFGLLGALAVPQSASAPCVICASQQAHNPVGFGFNDFVNNGSLTTFNMFSTNITGALADGVRGTPYTTGQLRGVLDAITPGFDVTFGIAIDINTAGGPNGDAHHLDFFQLINLGLPGTGDEEVIFDIRNVAMPVIDNGNGKADYLLTGFDLSGVNLGDRLIFRAAWHGASDGGESFYIVPNLQAVPGPAVGAGLPALLAGLFGLFGFNRLRRRRLAA